MKELLGEIGVTEANGILLDLGVSSHQLDTQARGFSYKSEAPLDMRMDRTAALTARDVVNGYAEPELARIFFEYGEERFSRRIANRICQAREQYPIETTLQLAQIVREAIPAKYRNEPQHPARRAFQALRIEVNGELRGLDHAVEAACDLLQKGGRLCIITFHSLEDRIAKQAFRRFENPCTCPPSAPVCVCGKEPKAKVLTRKPLTASAEEEARNSRSSSAKLRCIEKI
jgi:16S rRNA (cytosine1402-N4)-methyltransferase